MLTILLVIAMLVCLVEGRVQVFQSFQKVYESVLDHKVVISGKGFTPDMQLSFEADSNAPKSTGYVADVDYSMKFINSEKVKLSLMPGKKWKMERGFSGEIKLKDITIEGNTYPIGVVVAVIIENPFIENVDRNASPKEIRESQTKQIDIMGRALHTTQAIKLIPTELDAFSFKSDQPAYNVKGLQLISGKSWLPAPMSLKDKPEGTRIPLQVYSIDTGAGEVVFKDPVTIAYIIADAPGFICDDSCTYSFNWRCEDPSMKLYGITGDKEVMRVCAEGTDCTDCGGIEELVKHKKLYGAAVSVTAPTKSSQVNGSQESIGTLYWIVGSCMVLVTVTSTVSMCLFCKLYHLVSKNLKVRSDDAA